MTDREVPVAPQPSAGAAGTSGVRAQLALRSALLGAGAALLGSLL